MNLRTLFTQEKRYRIGKLKPYIYLFDKSNTMILYNRNECYDIASDSSYILHCASAKFVSTSSESGKYQFKSSIEIVLDETTAIDNYSILKQLLMKEWFVGFETLEGDRFLMSPEFESEVTYTFTANDTEKTNNTTVTFTVNTNIPNITVLTDFTYNHVMRGEYCGYQIGEITELRLAKADDTTVLINEASYNVIGSAVEVVEYSPKTLSFTEEYDGTSFNQTLQFDVPYEAFQHDFHYELLEFVKNEYLALMRTRLGNYVLAGHDLGMLPQYSISTSENNTPNTVQITLSYTSSSHGLLVADSISFEAGDDTTYTVEDWRCIDNLYSGTLVKGVSSEGTSYYCLEGYKSEYSSYNITDTYADIYTSQFGIKLYNTSVSCTSTDEDTCNVSGLPSTVTFTEIGQTQTFNVTSACPLAFTTQDNCEVTFENNTLSITNLVDDNYTITVKGDGFLHTINVIVAIQIETNSYYDITAEAQTINVTLEQSIANIVGTVKPATVTILPTEDNLGYYVSVTQNNSFTDTVEHVIKVTYSNDDTEIITITQDHMYERYVNDGTQMCDGNDLYDYAKHYIGYESDDINIDDGYVKISLNTVNSSECTADIGESVEKETVCLNGFIYTVLDIYDGDGNFLYTKAEKTTESCEDGNYDPDGDGTTQTTYERWVTNDLMQECVDGVVYAYEVREISTDNTNWYPTDERRLSTKILEYSDLCDIIGDTTDSEESYMTVTPSTLTFSASGGTKRVSVQYNHPVYNAFSNEGTSATWCTSVGVGSNYYNTYQEEGHDITVEENTSSEPRECIVVYAYQNIIGDEVEATVTVYQEGSTLQTRDIVLDITSDYTCDGTSKYYTIAHQESTDGVFWTTVSTSLGDLYEENSADCGYANPASITLVTPSLDVNYAAQNKYIQVNYINAGTINAPIYDAEWVSVTQNQSGSTTTNGDPTLQVQYKLAILASTETRSEDITFSCFGKDGGTAEATFKLTQTVTPLYQTSEISPTDDWICVGYDKYIKVEQQVSYDNGTTWVTTATTQGDLFESNSADCGYEDNTSGDTTTTTSISVDTSQLAFTSDGGSMEVIVTYTNIAEIYDPVCSEWIILTETNNDEGTDNEGNETKTVTYLVTVDTNTSTARESSITFSGMGYDGVEITNDSLTVNQSSSSSSSTSGEYDVLATFNVTDTSTATHIYSGKNVTASSAWTTTSLTTMYIDDEEVTPTVEFTFPTTGEHTVGYNFVDNTKISNGAFCQCSGMTSVKIRDGITVIGIAAFNNCIGLTSVTIPDSVTSIGGSAFNSCTSLTAVTIPNSVTEMGYIVFDRCYSLKTCNIPDSVTSMGDYTFGDCTSLTAVTIGNGITSIKPGTFNNCIGLTSVTIPDSITSIEGYAFSECSGLTNIEIPNSVTEIGDLAFSNCSGLTSIVIPDSVTTIGVYAFSECSSLTAVTIPDSITTIINGLFAKCTSLTSVTIPDGVTEIAHYAFYHCSGLTSIVIPSNVNNIGQEAFNHCSNLNSIQCNATTAPTIVLNTFGDDATSGILYYPSGSDYSTWLNALGDGWVGQEI